MAQVEIPRRLLERTGGTARLEVEGRNVRQLLRNLEEKFPGLVGELKATTAIAIDGEIIGQRLEDAVLERVEADSEVYFIPAVAGGCAAAARRCLRWTNCTASSSTWPPAPPDRGARWRRWCMSMAPATAAWTRGHWPCRTATPSA